MVKNYNLTEFLDEQPLITIASNCQKTGFIMVSFYGVEFNAKVSKQLVNNLVRMKKRQENLDAIRNS